MPQNFYEDFKTKLAFCPFCKEIQVLVVSDSVTENYSLILDTSTAENENDENLAGANPDSEAPDTKKRKTGKEKKTDVIEPSLQLGLSCSRTPTPRETSDTSTKVGVK